ncbi:MAG: HDOD domain-containing protein [Acidobacteria bacterium]|nr:HDOD domain-containing protein [Acidobacteriota bacterium]
MSKALKRFESAPAALLQSLQTDASEWEMGNRMKAHNWGIQATSISGSYAEPSAFAANWWDGVRALPTLPSVLFRFLGLVGDSRNTVEEIAEFVCQDPALLARVLPVLPEGFSSVDDKPLRQAISSLGRDRLRALAHTTPLVRSLDTACSGSYAATLWERSLLCATAAQAAASFLGLTRPERYYVGGLLHDLGYLVALQKRSDLFTSALRLWTRRPAGLLEMEAETFGANHCEIGISVARQLQIHPWFYPAIACHHTPALDGDQVSRITALASAFCSWQGLDLFPKQLFSTHSFTTGFREREARTREMHEILRGLVPQLLEIDRHHLLASMLSTVRPTRAAFRESFMDRFVAGESWTHIYRYAQAAETIAAVA